MPDGEVKPTARLYTHNLPGLWRRQEKGSAEDLVCCQLADSSLKSKPAQIHTEKSHFSSLPPKKISNTAPQQHQHMPKANQDFLGHFLGRQT